LDNILDQLLRDEGFRANPYNDSRGFRTVGIGHNLDANPLPDESYPMTVERAKEILANDVARIWTKFQTDLPWVRSLPDVYAGVLTNMSFNMGAKGLEAFHHMLADIQVGNYAKAASDGAQSAWYHEVGARAKRLMDQLRTGVWQ
jgi:lysozyme